MGRIEKELKEYRDLIGEKEYEKQYHFLYNQPKYNSKMRFSRRTYENSKEKINEIKEKIQERCN